MYKRTIIAVVIAGFFTAASMAQAAGFKDYIKEQLAKQQDYAATLNLLDADGDGTVSADEILSAKEQAFLQGDANGDGLLDLGELGAMETAKREDRLSARFGLVDTDLDNSVSLDEFLANVPEFADENAIEVFNIIAGADLSMSLDEFITLFGPEGRLAVDFVKLDEDGDGGVTLEEFTDEFGYGRIDALKDAIKDKLGKFLDKRGFGEGDNATDDDQAGEGNGQDGSDASQGDKSEGKKLGWGKSGAEKGLFGLSDDDDDADDLPGDAGEDDNTTDQGDAGEGDSGDASDGIDDDAVVADDGADDSAGDDAANDDAAADQGQDAAGSKYGSDSGQAGNTVRSKFSVGR